MRLDPSLLWTWNRTIDRGPYLLAGVLLFLLKFGIDWTVATQVFGQPWSPFNYLVWPNDRLLHVFELDQPERAFSLTMLGLSLPFIWIGVILTLHRLRAAGLPLSMVLFFFAPLLNPDPVPGPGRAADAGDRSRRIDPAAVAAPAAGPPGVRPR